MSAMKIHTLLLGLSLFFSLSTGLRADDGVHELSTSTGKTYRSCQILKVEIDGVSFRHSQGMAKVLFTDLNAKWRDHFGYDPEKVRAAAQQKREARAKAQEAAMVAARDAAKANQEAYTAALERQTLAALGQFIRQQPYASQVLPFNATSIGWLGYSGPGRLPVYGAAYPTHRFRVPCAFERVRTGSGYAGGVAPPAGYTTGTAVHTHVGHGGGGSGFVPAR